MRPSDCSTNSSPDSSCPPQLVAEYFEAAGDQLVRTVGCGTWRSVSRCLRGSFSALELADAWDMAQLRGAATASDRSKGVIRMVDLFCGAGGLGYGAAEVCRSVGLEPIVEFAADRDRDVAEVYATNNRPRYVSHDSFEQLTGYLPDAPAGKRIDSDRFAPPLSELVGKVDLVMAGPPCQGFSNLNNVSRRDDERNDLYVATVETAIALESPLVLIENLPDARSDKKHALIRAQCLLLAAGYKIDWQVIKGVDLGLPQTRRRLFLAASLFGEVDIKQAVGAFAREQRDLRWAIGDLETTKSDHPFDQPSELSSENKARIAHLFETDAYELANEHRPECHRNGHTYGAVYGRLSWDKPAPTITGGFLVPGRGRFIHPSKQRTLTPHEAARVQGFSDSFRFVDRWGGPLARTTYAKAIGNAVPPPMARAAVAALLTTLPNRN